MRTVIKEFKRCFDIFGLNSKLFSWSMTWCVDNNLYNNRMNIVIGLCHVEICYIDTFSHIAEEEVEMTSQATIASIYDSEKVSISNINIQT